MTRFSVGGGNDREGGPSNRPPKRSRENDPRSTPTPPTPTVTPVAAAAATRVSTPTAPPTVIPIRAPSVAHRFESDSDDDDSCGSNKEQPLPVSNVHSGQVASTDTNGSISFILTDPEVLDCDICYDPLKIPVFQCENGHIACSSCCTKVKNKCPTCSMPIGYNRCRAIEKVLESVHVSCENIRYGCKEQVTYSKKKDHEDTCMNAPFSCPLPGCSFVGSTNQLSQHFTTQHSTTAKSFQFDRPVGITLTRDQESLILQEQKEGALYIVKNKPGGLGNAVTINCIGPRTSKRKFSYEITLMVDGFSLRSHITPTRQPDENPLLPYMYLPIPSVFFSPFATLVISIKHPVHQMAYGLAQAIKASPPERRNDPPTGPARQ